MATEEKVPVIEVYGPVLQGEGAVIGYPTWFVRLGGCDYRCYYCDSMHAVDGLEINKRKRVMSASELADEVLAKMGTCKMVTLSGGNPALWPLGTFVRKIRDARKMVAVETQASIWINWLSDCNFITLSPKGPSMVDSDTVLKGKSMLFKILMRLQEYDFMLRGVSVKIPVFDSSDLEFADGVRKHLNASGLRDVPLFLSVGNVFVPKPAELGMDKLPGIGEQRELLLSKLDKISCLVFQQYPELMHSSILPQLHVLLFGNELGR